MKGKPYLGLVRVMVVTVLGAIGLGLAVAGLPNVVFKSPDGYPNLHVIAATMDELGIGAIDLRPSDRQSWGVRRFDAASSTGQRTQIKVYSRDAGDAQFWSKMWRFIWFRDSVPDLTITRLQQVEHEALMHLMAAQSGATAASVLTAARTDNGEAVLALGWDGTSPARGGAASLDDEALQIPVWSSVAGLHAAELAHGQLNLEAVRIAEADVATISEFDRGSIAASESRINTDVAELLFSTASVVGPDRAVATADEGLGTERLVDAAPYLRAPAISSTNRTPTKDQRALLASLRDRVAELAGVEPREPASLKRVTGKDILGGGLALIAGYVLISELAGLDWSTIFEDLKNAHWAWILAAFIVAQFTLVTEGISLMSVVERELPDKPTLYLQSASTFVGIALPGPAGRVTIITTFLRSYGVSPVLAVTQSSVDSIAGFITEAAILVVAVAFSDFRLGLNSEQDTDWSMIGMIVLIAAGVEENVAFAVAVVYRIVQFYLPPAMGYFALRWLEREDYV